MSLSQIEDTMARIRALLDTAEVSSNERLRLTEELRGILENGEAPVEADDMWSPVLSDTILADAYREAALAGCDMTRTADALERLRSATQSGLDLFETWDVMDDCVATAFKAAHEPVLKRLRQTLEARALELEAAEIQRAFAKDRSAASQAWIVRFAEALLAWRLTFAEALAGLPVKVTPEDEPLADKIRATASLVRQQRWPHCLDLYVSLSDCPYLTAPSRAHLLTIASEIASYHIQRTPGDRDYLNEAEALAPDYHEVLRSRGALLFHEGQDVQAGEYAERALDAREDNINAHVLLAEIDARRGDGDAAEEHLQEAIRIRPGHPGPYAMLIRFAGDAATSDQLRRIPELLERADAARPDSLVDNAVEAGIAYQKHNKFNDALVQFDRMTAAAPENTLGSAWKGNVQISLDDLDGAEQTFRTMLDLTHADPDAYFGLGSVAEKREDYASAAEWYREGAEKAPFRSGQLLLRAASALSQVGDLAEATALMHTELSARPGDPGIRETAEWFAARVSNASPDAANDVYAKVLDALGPDYAVTYHCKLADIAIEARTFDEAMRHLEKALAEDPENPQIYTSIARIFRQSEAWEASRGLFEGAPEAVQQDSAFTKEMSLLRNSEANRFFERGDYDAAMPLYEAAVAFSPKDEVLHKNLAGAYEKAPSGTDLLERLEKARASMARAAELDPSDAGIAAELERLAETLRFTKSFGKVAEMLPVVTPVALEVASDLIHHFDGGGGQLTPECARFLDKMRTEMRETMGVELPSVRVRGNDGDLTAGSYILILDEIPRVLGYLEAKKRFSPSTPEALRAAGLWSEPAENPMTGREGGFLSEEEWARAEAEGVPLWSFLEYPLRRLYAFVESNLSQFVGHQEIANLLAEVGTEAAGRLLGAPEALTRFVQVLRTLLDERLPIVAIGELSTVFERLEREGMPLDDIAEALRRLPEMRPHLVRDTENISLFEAGPALVELLRESHHSNGGPTLLAMRPHACQAVLTAVREAVSDNTNPVLVIGDPALRAMTRRLLVLEFPNLSILSEDELDPPLAALPRTSVTVDGP